MQSIIAGRQNVPDSTELIAGIAGTKTTWITTHQTDEIGASGRGSRIRGYEYDVHPSTIKQLGTGQAVVITPGSGERPSSPTSITQAKRTDELCRAAAAWCSSSLAGRVESTFPAASAFGSVAGKMPT